jgi:DNA-directed RNA polymerase subunit RPC12/RpoP
MKCKICGDELTEEEKEFYEDSCHNCQFKM